MRTRLIVLAVSVLAFAVVAKAADDSFVGTWKMNLAKSKFSDPSSASKSYISSVESLKNRMFKYTLDYVAPDGQAVHFYFNCLRDGKDYPVIGDSDADAVAFTQADPNTTPYIVKKGGKQLRIGAEAFVSSWIL